MVQRRRYRAAHYSPTGQTIDSFCRELRLTLLIFENRRLHLQHNTENRSAPHLAAYFDAAAVLPDDVLRYPQPQTSSFFAGGKERIEDSCQIVFGNPDAAIAELNQNGRLQRLFIPRSRDHDLAVAFDRLLRIDDEIEKHLAQLIGARANVRQRLVERLRDPDAQLAHLLFHEHERLFEQLIDVDPIDFTRTARKSEHLPDNVRHAFRLFARDLEEARILVAFAIHLHQVERVLDRFEWVIDFVRDRRRETSDGREFF